jgi:inhibitor of KinA
MEIKIYGESALLINYEQKIDRMINEQVTALKTAIEKTNISGVINCIPAYCSLLIKYDAQIIEAGLLINIVRQLCSSQNDAPVNANGKKLILPVCYDMPYALDLKDLSKDLDVSESEIIQLHTSTDFRVYMLGFLPGFPYMGILPKKLNCNRKAVPRLHVPARSVALAGQQTGIYPIGSPGGWQIIGQTPLDIFNAINGPDFLFSAGDEVQFHPVSENEFVLIRNDVEKGKFNYQSMYA